MRIGRPRSDESQARTRELLRLVAGGASLTDAAAGARVKPDRVLRLLDDPEFRGTVFRLLGEPPREAAA